MEAVQNKSVKEQQEENLKLIQEFLKDPKNKDQAIMLACQIRDEISKDWVSVDQVADRFEIDKASATAKLEMLKLFRMCINRINDETGNKEYQISFDKKVYIKVAEEEILFHQEKIKLLKKELKELKKEVEPSDKK